MRLAIGDIQGCYRELRELLRVAGFSPDRDRLWLVGDLVNRGPDSLEVLRFVRDLGEAAITVLGNHDLHLLAVASGGERRPKPGDTLDAVLAAPDRERLLDWLRTRPLAHRDAASGDLMIHAGALPAWSVDDVLALAAEIEAELRERPQRLFEHMYGNQPDAWDYALRGHERRRVVVNALTRLRYCTRDGRMNLKLKGAPDEVRPPWLPWFDVPGRRTRDARIVCGHWSTLGLVERDDLLALDTGCVWGGALSARDLDSDRRWRVPCSGYQAPGGD